MGHPIIDELCRVHGPDDMRFEFFQRCKRILRDEVNPMLDERERLLEENMALKADLEKLTAPKRAKAETAA